MIYKCPECGDVMEGKTTKVEGLRRRYQVDCRCTEEMATEGKAKAFQKKHWKKKLITL